MTREDLRPDRETMSGLFRVGLPVCVQDGCIQLGFIIITIIANRRGLTDAAAVGVVEKLIGFFFLIPSTMLSTVSALSAQNVGAGRQDRARLTLRYAAMIAVGWGIVVSLTMLAAAELFIGLFTSDPAVAAAGGQYMCGYVWDCIFAGIHFSFSGYFCANRLSLVSFCHNFLSVACVRVPLAWLSTTYFPETLFPMGLASTFGSLFSVMICVGVFVWMERRGRKDAAFCETK